MVIIPQRKRKKKPVVKKERKFDLGPRGELILIRKKGRGNYAIGMLEGRTTIQDRRGARFPVPKNASCRRAGCARNSR